MMNKVALLLSTYNGELFLEDLLNSLLKQTYRNFVLFIRDDGSSDSTKGIIAKFSQAYNNIIILEANGNVGSKRSFSYLLDYAVRFSDCNYFMFVDQDDVWLPKKIEITQNKMVELENSYPQLPILIHSNLKVVSQDLTVISKSFWFYQNLDPEKDGVNRLLMQNVITGCTVLINRSLASICLPIPKAAIMHDWWIGLVASAFGKIGYIKQPTILYRQHGNNNLGAKKFNIINTYRKLLEKDPLNKNFIQSEEFLKIFYNQLNKEQIDMFICFGNLRKVNYFKRIKLILKYKFFKIGLLRNIGVIFKECKSFKSN